MPEMAISGSTQDENFTRKSRADGLYKDPMASGVRATTSTPSQIKLNIIQPTTHGSSRGRVRWALRKRIIGKMGMVARLD